MINLTAIKTLTLIAPSQPERQSHLSAASGLVQASDYLYVVADDENYLGVFQLGRESGYLKKLFDSELPLEHEARKAVKPDLEVLTLIPPSKKHKHGALLALGSGSKTNRKQAVIISLQSDGQLDNELEILDLTVLYDEINNKIGKLNIEGAITIGDDIILFQRGNKKNKINATIQLSLKKFYRYTGIKTPKESLNLKITHYDLGEINGVPLCFTDATALADGTIIFTAAAENTSDTYLDGECMGSAIGIIRPNGELHSIDNIDVTIKLEGIEATISDTRLHLLLVSDADNEAIPATLYSTVLNGYPFQ